MNDWGMWLIIAGVFLVVLLVLNLMLTRKKKPKKDTRTSREKNIDKIAGSKGVR